MDQRLSNIQEVCYSYKIQESSNLSCSFQSKVSKYSQEINLNNFLRELNTGTIYCYIHKVASSTWMSFFARLENNTNFLRYAEKTGNYYKVKSRLKPGILDLFEEDQINFLIIRHPLDRILSAFRDRILNQNTYQAKKHSKLMKKYPALKGEKLPTFSQFLQYITDDHEDPHWSPYHSLCSPCTVDYDWIIKLEDHNLKDLEDSLLQTSGMTKYGRLQIKNISKQPTRQTRDIYKKVSCEVIQRVIDYYYLDFILFQYSHTEYLASIGLVC